MVNIIQNPSVRGVPGDIKMKIVPGTPFLILEKEPCPMRIDPPDPSYKAVWCELYCQFIDARYCFNCDQKIEVRK